MSVKKAESSSLSNQYYFLGMCIYIYIFYFLQRKDLNLILNKLCEGSFVGWRMIYWK